MPQAAYPTDDNLQSFLEAHGLTVTAAQQTLLAGAVAAAQTEFERRTDRTFLAEAVASVRYYDPPTSRERILFLEDFVALESVVYQPEGATVETLTLNEDYWLEPANALAKGQPYTQLRFRRRWLQPLTESLLQSLQVTARWGYSAQVPDDVWSAILSGAAFQTWTQITQATTGGILQWSDGGRSVSYGVERWTALKDTWQGQFERCVARYRRVTF